MAYAAPVAPTAEKCVGAHEQHWQKDRIWLSDSVLLLWTKVGAWSEKLVWPCCADHTTKISTIYAQGKGEQGVSCCSEHLQPVAAQPVTIINTIQKF